MSNKSLYSSVTYAAMPVFYGLVGVAIVVWQNPLFIISGVVLLCAAIYTGLARVWYRRAFSASNGFITLPVWKKGQGAEGGGLQIAWRKAYECGHPVIDAQHRRMFGLCNDLSSMVASNRPKADIVKLVDKMVQHLEQHFKTEELTRMRMHRPMSAVHLDNHAKLLQEAQDWLGKLRVGAPVERDIVNFFVYTVIKDHIARESNMFNASARPVVTAAAASKSDHLPATVPLLDDGNYGSPEFTEPAPLSERGFLSFDDADDWPKTVFMPDSASGDAQGRNKVFIWRD